MSNLTTAQKNNIFRTQGRQGVVFIIYKPLEKDTARIYQRAVAHYKIYHKGESLYHTAPGQRNYPFIELIKQITKFIKQKKLPKRISIFGHSNLQSPNVFDKESGELVIFQDYFPGGKKYKQSKKVREIIDEYLKTAKQNLSYIQRRGTTILLKSCTVKKKAAAEISKMLGFPIVYIPYPINWPEINQIARYKVSGLDILVKGTIRELKATDLQIQIPPYINLQARFHISDELKKLQSRLRLSDKHHEQDKRFVDLYTKRLAQLLYRNIPHETTHSIHPKWLTKKPDGNLRNVNAKKIAQTKKLLNQAIIDQNKSGKTVKKLLNKIKQIQNILKNVDKGKLTKQELQKILKKKWTHLPMQSNPSSLVASKVGTLLNSKFTPNPDQDPLSLLKGRHMGHKLPNTFTRFKPDTPSIPDLGGSLGRGSTLRTPGSPKPTGPDTSNPQTRDDSQVDVRQHASQDTSQDFSPPKFQHTEQDQPARSQQTEVLVDDKPRGGGGGGGSQDDDDLGWLPDTSGSTKKKQPKKKEKKPKTGGTTSGGSTPSRPLGNNGGSRNSGNDPLGLDGKPDNHILVNYLGRVTEYDEKTDKEKYVGHVGGQQQNNSQSNQRTINPYLDDTFASGDDGDDDRVLSNYFATRPADPSPDENEQEPVHATSADVFHRFLAPLLRTTPYFDDDASEPLTTEEQDRTIQNYFEPKPIDPASPDEDESPRSLPSELPDDLPATPTSTQRSGKRRKEPVR